MLLILPRSFIVLLLPRVHIPQREREWLVQLAKSSESCGAFGGEIIESIENVGTSWMQEYMISIIEQIKIVFYTDWS